MSTIEEIAKIAGVSASTVSRALARNKKISEHTIQRIEKIANELHYTPNLSARALTGKGTKLIGLIVPEITSNHYVQIVNRVESELYAKGYALIIGTTDFNADKGLRNLEVFIGRAVDGIIFAGDNLDEVNAAAVRDIIKTPIVFLGSAGDNTGHECVAVDDAHGISLLIRHLIELGHKSFGFIGEKLSKPVRLPPFQKALAEWGLEYNENFIKTDGTERFEEGGYLRMKELLAEGEMPTAVFATYDNIAIGAMKALHEAGLKVPEDVSIIGFDNIKESEYLIPALTTVFPPITEMADRAVDMLIEKIEKKDTDKTARKYTAAKTILYPELVIRQSTSVPRQ
ncbi:LacI family DNA-binding transcriptional regulator [Paenibacillus mendelii]|uniref:LacI family DNA-binding transcriptional regulator n=1 Tax=Paenibacillus mendelii TaxID=206163 RepID=A0ABV6JFM4_9BACL|nr:LacI family DNA-binding transcriptional regulator [Paenibacillus mendelii]MCQ6557476.1 LacI family transcriptional regulator [Paenibacillus mendelii]